ncbi:MAG: hypothetical protein R3F62_09010 [Planctomycetota bacterium]
MTLRALPLLLVLSLGCAAEPPPAEPDPRLSASFQQGVARDFAELVERRRALWERPGEEVTLRVESLRNEVAGADAEALRELIVGELAVLPGLALVTGSEEDEQFELFRDDVEFRTGKRLEVDPTPAQLSVVGAVVEARDGSTRVELHLGRVGVEGYLLDYAAP